MLVQPKVKLFIEMDAIVLELEDEGILIKIDITEQVLPLVQELDEKEDTVKVRKKDLERLKGYVTLLENGKLDLEAIKQINDRLFILKRGGFNS